MNMARTSDTVKLRQRSDALYEEARAHPGSDADHILRTLVLTGMSRMETELDQTRSAVAQERQHHERRARATPVSRARRGKGSPQSRRQVQETTRRLQQVIDTLESARKAKASGKSLTDSEIYNRIATVVGLRAPKPVLTKPNDEMDEGADEAEDEC
jgi:hypothetical protein